MNKKYIFFDESGDLGFAIQRPSVSNNFYVTFLLTETPKEIDRVVKKVSASVKKTRGALHANREKKETVSRMLRYLSRKEVEIYTLIVDKSKLPQNYRQALKRNLYIEFCGYLVDKLPRSIKYDFTAAKYFTKKSDNEKFITKIATPDLFAHIEYAHRDRCLQAVDFIAYAMNRKYEIGDSSLVDLIKDKIIKEMMFRPRQNPRSLSGRTPSGPNRGIYMYSKSVSKRKGDVK
ncbi:DUF3800 domain-containing protein [Candidatus Saccharibacteria bacterium]|nr:DUF3800 domain-containing protein [Candidatus Saccharibacteria bacterium]